MFFWEKYSLYILTLTITLVGSGIISYFTDIKYQYIVMFASLLVIIAGVSMNSENSYRPNNAMTYDIWAELRHDKERRGDYDYSDRSHGFSPGMKLVFSGIFLLIIGGVLDYILINFF